MSVSSEPDPILRVTIGSPIYTKSYEMIGRVKERRGNAFKVGTPFLQRDFWLGGEVLRTAAPDGPVMLGIEKADLSSFKRGEPPAAA